MIKGGMLKEIKGKGSSRGELMYKRDQQLDRTSYICFMQCEALALADIRVSS